MDFGMEDVLYQVWILGLAIGSVLVVGGLVAWIVVLKRRLARPCPHCGADPKSRPSEAETRANP